MFGIAKLRSGAELPNLQGAVPQGLHAGLPHGFVLRTGQAARNAASH